MEQSSSVCLIFKIISHCQHGLLKSILHAATSTANPEERKDIYVYNRPHTAYENMHADETS